MTIGKCAPGWQRHFGSVEKVMSAPREELMEVELVGARIAERIRELAGGRYD